MSELSGRYDLPFMMAYIRGELAGEARMFQKPLSELTEADDLALTALAQEKGLKLHYFKRFDELPRVRAVLGFLRGVGPESLLDVGSGRGVFLFPFMRQFPDTPVTSLDILEKRVRMLDAMRRGGLDRLTPLLENICTWREKDGAFDVVTLLEVMEHIPDVEAAARNAVRLARRFVVVTVPSKPDDNPEHIHLLTKEKLTDLFQRAGCRGLRFDGVPGHLVMIAKK